MTENGAATQFAWDTPIRIGVSSCLIGCKVRFDGGHKKDDFLTGTFGQWVEWVPVCPEVEAGMGTPRESVRLVRSGNETRMVAPRSRLDWTDEMRTWAEQRVHELESKDLCGYVLKKDSPSCGIQRVKIYTEAMPVKNGRGVFAGMLLDRFPWLPIEEEGRLCDPRLRDNFVERVFAYRRLKDFFHPRWTVGELVAFHTAHRLQLMAHSQKAHRSLGRLVAAAKGQPPAALAAAYEQEFMASLTLIATPRRNTNVLHHILGYFRDSLDTTSRHELLAVVSDYSEGLVPLIVPLTLVRHHVRRLGIAYLAGQTYLEPHPRELMLRNHV